ncbi:MAG: hypothetical protein EBZ48_17550, partial [Proteobacteria bacterium]|nr:hypothetical protein [Pseudomonadota bacterium]
MTKELISGELSRALLDGEPFHIVFDRDCVVQSLGRSLLVLDPALQPGTPCAECFEIQVPIGMTLAELWGEGGLRKATVRLSKIELSLRGQFVFASDGSAGAFLGSPWFTRVEDFNERKISLSMLPAHYGILEN